MFPFLSSGKESPSQGLENAQRDPFSFGLGGNTIPPPFSLSPLNYYHHCLIQHYRQQGFFPYFTDPFLHPSQLRGEACLPHLALLEKQKQNRIENPSISLSSLIKVEEPDEPAPLMQQKALEQPQRSSPTKPNKQLQPFSLGPRDSQALISAFQRLITEYVDEGNGFKKAEEACLNLGSPNGPRILEDVLASLKDKFHKFKKTKEELIKFIIRRIYHNLRVNKNLNSKPEYQRLQAFHQKNLTAFRSMNVQFLRREFSNPLFVDLFKEFLNELPELFESENKEKIRRLALVMGTALMKKSTACLQNEKKMPWTTSYKLRIRKVCIQLLKEFEGSGAREAEELKSSPQI